MIKFIFQIARNDSLRETEGKNKLSWLRNSKLLFNLLKLSEISKLITSFLLKCLLFFFFKRIKTRYMITYFVHRFNSLLALSGVEMKIIQMFIVQSTKPTTITIFFNIKKER